MSIELANSLALAGWGVQFLIVFFVVLLFIRDLLRGENGMTPGLLVLSIGVLIINSLALFAAITIHDSSLAGWLYLPDRLDADYEIIITHWQVAGAWIINIGFLLVGWANYRIAIRDKKRK